MEHAGIGPTHVNNFLTTMNIPAVDPKLLRRQERVIGPVIEKVAQESCDTATQDELSATAPSEGITMSYDCGWQKRGRAMNSLTGVGHTIGLHTKKILRYVTRSKRCATCYTAERLGKQPEPHDCRKNFSKSSKAMEADAIAEIGASLQTAGVTIGVLVGDDDSSAIKRLRETCGENIEKASDMNHIKKNLGNALYKLKSEGHKELSDKVIKYIQKLFMYAVCQNTNDVDGLRAALASAVPHAYGDHTSCGKWCGFSDDPPNYRHTGLPRGKDLSSTATRDVLSSLFTSYIENADKLARHGSSQANESFNNTVASKQPKSRHYGSSPSFNFRVGAAVAQKNVGHTYVTNVVTATGLSPSKHSQEHGERLDTLRFQKSRRQAKREVKRRRLELKDARSQKLGATELREGVHYQTECALSGNVDSAEISAPVSLEHYQISPDTKLVVWDLETTGLGTDAEIVQLAAASGDEKFAMYILPSSYISPRATEVTGLSTQIVSGNRCLMKAGVTLETAPLALVADKFISWLVILSAESLVMVGHNTLAFDCRVLFPQFLSCGTLDRLLSVISGFADTLPVFKTVYPNQPRYTQESLISSLLGSSYNAHDAAEDVAGLQALITGKLSVQHLNKHCFTSSSVLARHNMLAKSKQLLAELAVKIPRSCLSASMADKIAKSGLSFNDLQLAFSRGGRSGTGRLLSEADGTGKPRVTKTASVIRKLGDFFEPPGTTSNHDVSNQQVLVTGEQLALFLRRKEEGYDLPDPEYIAWLSTQS